MMKRAQFSFSRNLRRFATTTEQQKMIAPPMVYISGEEMTRYCMTLVLDKWIYPFVDTSMWQYYDLSCVSRDNSEDKCLRDAVKAGKTVGAIFKEPTVTPTEIQKKALGLKKTWGSPNGAMRRGWNGITISRDTIHIDGMELGFKNPVLFERHAVGGEYAAGYANVSKGVVTTIYTPEDRSPAVIIDHRYLEDEQNAIVTYSNPLDNVEDLAHHFFSRCLEAGVTPYVVTKKTVFKWQEPFWKIMKDVFDRDYLEAYTKAGLLKNCGGELQHLISDAASMKILQWTQGGFGMAAHNYDGDMLTDEIAQVHRSPGFITSNLIGKREDGEMIKEFEASHGTVADMWEAHLRGEETSLNPLGMVEALLSAIQHSCALTQYKSNEDLVKFTKRIRTLIHKAMISGHGTRDLCGPSGLTTEQFVDFIASKLVAAEDVDGTVSGDETPAKKDDTNLQEIFGFMDTDGNGSISYDEFQAGLEKLSMERLITYHYENMDRKND